MLKYKHEENKLSKANEQEDEDSGFTMTEDTRKEKTRRAGQNKQYEQQ